MIQHSPFDSVAKEYDDLYEEQLITKELRPLIRKSLIDYLKPGDHILELNCGTGTDAIAFAQEGINVMATDLSEVMLETSSRKVGERHLENRITFRQVDFNSFSPATFNNARFDGVFSNFDGLNCSPNIAHVLDAIADCLKPRGTVVMCVLNKVCIWEIATFLLRGNVKSAFRRFNKGTQIATVGDSTVPVW